jgi:hypothetical protein
MVAEYGREKIRRTLDLLGDGYTYDNALRGALGVDMDALEEAWRKAIGADPMLKKPVTATPAGFLDRTLAPGSSSLIVSNLTLIPSITHIPSPTESNTGDEFPRSNRNSEALLVGCGAAVGMAAISAAGVLLIWSKRKISFGSREKGR